MSLHSLPQPTFAARSKSLLCSVLICTDLLLPNAGCPEEEEPPPDVPNIEVPEVPTPSDHGACCLPDGQCTDASNRAACDTRGGYWHGIGTTCAEVVLCNSSGPFRDLCENAQPCSGEGPFVFNTNEDRSSTEGLIPRSGGCRRIWLDAFACWTADQTGRYAMDTCGEENAVNTLIAVYDGCACTLTLERMLACNDDGDACESGGSRLEFEAVAGMSYMLHAGEHYNEVAGGAVYVRVTYLGPIELPDADEDGVLDADDNCPEAANPNQADSDDDGAGDACDPDADFDGDGFINADDNCPTLANPGQEDADGNGVGDVCEPTADNDEDGVPNVEDNCPNTSNEDQADADDDGVGDACDDSDNDGILSIDDNCPDTANEDQADADSDGIGDACEPDSDNDGTIDDEDGCPEDPEKTAPGACGCGNPDTDANSNGTPDCTEEPPVTLRLTFTLDGEPVVLTVFVWENTCLEGEARCTGMSSSLGVFECAGLTDGLQVCVYAYNEQVSSGSRSFNVSDTDGDGVAEFAIDVAPE
ncbi:Alpha-agarase precursor [Phycisphaerae bacterium RAS1]|nr:Alpha-agarase precursor [Phycisphaerae bacterium RAS1]